MIERRIAILVLLMSTGFGATGAELPTEIAATGETVVLQVHAVGAQIYECKAGANGQMSWQFREPIATLFRDGKTVGKHYAGPSWEIDHSVIVGTVTARTPGETAKDIPWLKLDVSEARSDVSGSLEEVRTVQRVNTKGGALEGACEKAGDYRPEPYSADYIFLQKPR